MADWLLLRLGRDEGQPPAWACVAASGPLTQQPVTGDRDALQEAARQRRVMLVVPGTDVLQTRLLLPPGSESRLAQVVPNALEEQLADDIDRLHFATARAGAADGQTDVDVVSHERLQGWLAAAAEWGVVPQAVCADSSLLPQVQGVTALLLDHDSLVVSVFGRRPLVLPGSDVELALALALGDDASRADRHLQVFAVSQDWAAHSAAFEALRPTVASLKVQLLSAGLLPLVAPQAAAQQAINLLQGRYAPRASASGGWRRWRVAAAAALALGTVHLAAQAWQVAQLSRTQQQLQTQLRQQVQALVPGEAGGVGTRVRLQQRLAQAGGGAQDSAGLLALLQAVASTQNGSQPVRLQSLGFGRGALDLKLSGADANALEHVSQGLRQAGYASELAAGAQHGERYEGRIQVRVAGPVRAKGG